MSKHADFYKENLKQKLFTVRCICLLANVLRWRVLSPLAPAHWKPCFHPLETTLPDFGSVLSTHQKQNIIQRLVKYHPSESKVSSAGGQSKLVCTSKHHQTEAKTSSDEEQTNLLCRAKHDWLQRNSSSISYCLCIGYLCVGRTCCILAFSHQHSLSQGGLVWLFSTLHVKVLTVKKIHETVRGLKMLLSL